MHSIEFFAEDRGHEAFLTALVGRLACHYQMAVEIRPYSVRGGRGRVLRELRQYVRDLQRRREYLPDLIIVAMDANCKRYLECRRELDREIPDEFRYLVVHAIPDPHIERWLLLDSSAFKAVLGTGCAVPDHKCERDRYKRLLIEAIRNAGLSPLIGGMEYAEDIVHHMDLRRMAQMNETLAELLTELLTELTRRFKEWRQT